MIKPKRSQHVRELKACNF